uniref:Uncharacterized protein n=1 Tax=Arundo donax TaxID=35708 RepID=A0A0A9C508_ARUDO
MLMLPFSCWCRRTASLLGRLPSFSSFRRRRLRLRRSHHQKHLQAIASRWVR